MTDTQGLNDIIQSSGLKKSYLAEACGITVQALGNKINNKNYFNAMEIRILCDELKLTSRQRDRIFFAYKLQKC